MKLAQPENKYENGCVMSMDQCCIRYIVAFKDLHQSDRRQQDQGHY